MKLHDAYDSEQAKAFVNKVFSDRKCFYNKNEIVEAIENPHMRSPERSDGSLSPSAHLRVIQSKIDRKKLTSVENSREFEGSYLGLGKEVFRSKSRNSYDGSHDSSFSMKKSSHDSF